MPALGLTALLMAAATLAWSEEAPDEAADVTGEAPAGAERRETRSFAGVLARARTR